MTEKSPKAMAGGTSSKIDKGTTVAPPGLPSNLSIQHLLKTSKSLAPISDEDKTRLEEIQMLDASAFTEMDVREDIIAPVVRALGYKKQTDFSISREKHLKLMGDELYADYSLTLWEEHFWIIEAKKVKRKAKRFIAAEVKQAIIYATHPEIDAPLFVLCDGRIFHVFDRETSVTEPILKVEVKHLVRDFDKLRALLSPWQNWFFQKRRVLRLIDKVFDQEFNLERLSEFRSLVGRRIDDKRSTVLKNFQALEFNPTSRVGYLRKLSSVDLIDLQFFLLQDVASINTISQTLSARLATNSFEVMHAAFPDRPRDANSNYWAHALHFLLTAESGHATLSWLPAFLHRDGGAPTHTSAIKRLIQLCLGHFHDDPARRTVVLYSASARRKAKQILLALPQATELAEQQHALLRHIVPELDFSQFISSTSFQLRHLLDHLELTLTRNFVKSCFDDRGNFQLGLAQQALRDLWASERMMLGDGKRYRDARQGRSFDDSPLSEAISVGYDQLGHMALCVLEQFPKWKDFVLEHHERDVRTLASFGSWQARLWLGMKIDAPAQRPSLVQTAQRFFMGDEPLLITLASGYGISL